MKTIAIIKYALTAVGLALLIGALFWYQNVKTFIAGASVAQGTVVELVRSQSGSDSPTYRPVVRFNANGRAVEFVSSSGSNPPSYSRGEKVEVFYQPSKPQNAMINGFFSLWGGPLIVGGLGAVFFQWQDPATSELHIFKSNNLWFDPSEHIKQQQITVFIEGGNPKKYFVDLSFLPKLAS